MMSLQDNGRIKCDWCGRFIAIDSIILGTAYHQFVLPDSECSVETYESKCPRCIKDNIIRDVEDNKQRIPCD